MNRRAVFYACLSAVLFGFSTPAAKALLGSTDPWVLAGLLYSGAGLGVAIFRRLTRSMSSPAAARETALARADLPWLSGAIVAGGVIGPLLLMVGLSRTDAAAASLLLTLEGVATALLAWFIFHENFDRRIALGMACLVRAPPSCPGQASRPCPVWSVRWPSSAPASPGGSTTI